MPTPTTARRWLFIGRGLMAVLLLAIFQQLALSSGVSKPPAIPPAPRAAVHSPRPSTPPPYASARVAPPTPLSPAPSPRHLAWHALEMYAFMHFGPNTFSGKEWGYGDEPPADFNPTDFDASEMVKVLKDAGFRGVVLTAKHHDGFCLWPSATTDYTVAAPPFRGGKGDVVAEVAAAAAEHGLKFGLYVSPWDRHSALYGTPAYVTDVFQQQLRELLTRHPDVFYLWLDSAHGGSGYYGGRKSSVNVDFATYFRWNETLALVRALAKDAVIFSNSGPDIRWVGNERGGVHPAAWQTFTPSFFNGTALSRDPSPNGFDPPDAERGTRGGRYWMPPEADVSIRKGWFHHPGETPSALDAARLVTCTLVRLGTAQVFT